MNETNETQKETTIKSVVDIELLKRIEKLEKQMDISDKERLAELEVKMSKLWGMLVSYTPTKQEKLSKHGKAFGSILLERK